MQSRSPEIQYRQLFACLPTGFSPLMLFRAGCQTSEVYKTSEVSAVARSRRWRVVLRGYGTQSVLEGIPTQSVGTIETCHF